MAYRSETASQMLAEHSTHAAKGACTGRAIGVSLSHTSLISMEERCVFRRPRPTPFRGGLVLIDDLSAVEACDLAQALEPPREDLRGSDNRRQRVAHAFDNDSRLIQLV